MIAAIGADGTREVVWGLGSTEADAEADAREWLAEATGEPVDASLRYCEVDADQAHAIMNGVIDVATLGLRPAARDARGGLAVPYRTAEPSSRSDYVGRFQSLTDAVAFEDQCLSGDGLPTCARDVRAGREPSPAYWAWLIMQLAENELPTGE